MESVMEPVMGAVLQLVAPLLWALPLLLLAALCKSRRVKGWWGERKVRAALARHLDGRTYHAFHDVLLPAAHGGTTQIDHIYVSVHGVFVLETKHMQGWIFGSAHQAQWTQTFPRAQFKFQNPLRQNYLHVHTLQQALRWEADKFHSLVVFTGPSTFKTEMPPQVHTLASVGHAVRAVRGHKLSPQQVSQACALIAAQRIASTWRTRRAHGQQLRQRHGRGTSGRE